MRPRTQYYLGFGLLLAAASVYLFSLYPMSTTPEYIFALRSVERPTGPPSLYQPPHSAPYRWLDNDKGNS